ncbi:putative type VI secretion system effector [Burkholderia territorii]|uniref:putative type VI secretion system effector n=1 Tax=Burkholderia territorii TaxID=1503055 RepID=UPI0009BEFD6F|nr:putative type VI secretion system effector [Burkholderia territorii]
MENEQATVPVLLRGTITGLTKRRAVYEAVFTEADKQAMERTAVVAALAGLNDIALNLSTSTEFTDTVGDLVTFRLNGEEVRAWIWLSVFENGDEVEVVAERAESGWVGYAIRRCSDGILSVHPHCERGSRALFKFFLKCSVLFWSGCALAVTLLVASLMLYGGVHDRWIFFIKTFIVSWGVIEAMAVFIAYNVSRRFKRQLPMANKIFATFGWKDPPNVNLLKTSKKLRQPEDTWQMGKLIFRYGES